MANSNKPGISESTLWPVWLASRLFTGAFLLYGLATMSFIMFVANHAPKGSEIAYADKLLSEHIAYVHTSKAVQYGQNLHDWLFIRTGIKSSLQADKHEDILFSDTRKRLSGLPFMKLLERATFLFGLKAAFVVAIMPLSLLFILVLAYDGLHARAVRRVCAGKESASIYHRAKRWSSNLLPLLAALVYFCWPKPLNPDFLLVPVLIITGVLMYLMAKYYKKYF